jgi:hypothetical protein
MVLVRDMILDRDGRTPAFSTETRQTFLTGLK